MYSINKKKDKKSNIRKYILLILVLIIGLTWIEEKEYKTKIENIFSSIKEKKERTNLRNLFIIYKKNGLSLLFVNKNTNNIEIDELSGVGKIRYNTPIRVMKDKKFGFYNEKGELLIPFEYEQASDFMDGIAIVKKNKYGVIDKTGKMLLPYEYTNIILGEKRKVILERDSKYYLSDLKKGKEIEVNYIYPVDEKKVIFEKKVFLE